MTKRVDLLQNMLKEDPNDLFLNYAIALERIKEEAYDEAKEMLIKVLQMDSSYLPAYYQLGKLYEASGNINEAINSYKKGLVIAKENKDIRTQGEIEEALMIIEEDEEVE